MSESKLSQQERDERLVRRVQFWAGVLFGFAYCELVYFLGKRAGRRECGRD